MSITLYYTSIDGCHKQETCPDLQHAREWAHYWVGADACVGSHYAVSFDGVGKVSVGAGCSIHDLFPER